MKYYIQAWKNTFNFTGRARRAEYWTFALFNGVVGFLLGIAAVFTSSPDAMMAADTTGAMPMGEGLSPIFWLLPILQIALIVPSLSILVRRLHDTGRSGFWVLTLLIPFLNFICAIVLLVFTLSDSQPGDNKFGPSPKGGGNPLGTAPYAPSAPSSLSAQFGPQAPGEPETYVNPFTKSA